MKPRKELPVTLEHARLRQLADRLQELEHRAKELNKAPEGSAVLDPEINWLISALRRVGAGEDANVVFFVNRGAGHDDKKAEAHYMNQHAIRWVAGRLNPLDGSDPPSKRVAVSEAADCFGLDEDNLYRLCPSIKELKELAHFEWDSTRPRLQKT